MIYNPKIKETIKESLENAFNLANDNHEIVEFMFNGMNFQVAEDSNIDSLLKDYHFSKKHNKTNHTIGPLTILEYEEKKKKERLLKEEEEYKKTHPVKDYSEYTETDNCYRIKTNMYVAFNKNGFDKCVYECIGAIGDDAMYTKKWCREFVGQYELFPKTYPCVFTIDKSLMFECSRFHIDYVPYSKIEHVLALYRDDYEEVKMKNDNKSNNIIKMLFDAIKNKI